ncbi:MAG: sulfite exporter TauE/SafE family protein [Burkholderiaceae bacterium]
MDFALVLTALLMGLAGSLHCVAMCGATSAATVNACAGGRPRDAWTSFHLGRLAGYALAGAVAAASVGALARWSAWSPALRPLWTLLHVAALALGLWLLVRGRQPDWLERLGRSAPRPAQAAGGWQRIQGPAKAGATGLAWVAWPCGLLQSALVVAALANTAWGGAAVMGAFAVASAPALGLAPWLWLRWQQRRDGAAVPAQVNAWAIRLAGAMLAAASGWAIGHDLIRQFIAYCVS